MITVVWSGRILSQNKIKQDKREHS